MADSEVEIIIKSLPAMTSTRPAGSKDKYAEGRQMSGRMERWTYGLDDVWALNVYRSICEWTKVISG